MIDEIITDFYITGDTLQLEILQSLQPLQRLVYKAIPGISGTLDEKAIEKALQALHGPVKIWTPDLRFMLKLIQANESDKTEAKRKLAFLKDAAEKINMEIDALNNILTKDKKNADN